jgi:predicted alpha/beta hydrolase
MHKATVTTDDGFELQATTFGDSQRCRAGVLIVPAMAVEQAYYEGFARWLAERGYFVSTFDYRGIGRSRRGPLRQLEADVFTWARRDTEAMVEFVAGRIAERPLLWVGHSLGGQILGLLERRDRVTAMVTVAAGSGYWRDYVPGLRRLAPLLWYGIVPTLLGVFGYFPGRRLGMIGDVPGGVMRQWRSWCLHPDYLFGIEDPALRVTYAGLRQPILSVSFTDDEYMSARNIESLHSFYTRAPRAMRRIAPQEIGAERIGHFGFFRRRHAESLWPVVGDWLTGAAR